MFRKIALLSVDNTLLRKTSIAGSPQIELNDNLLKAFGELGITEVYFLAPTPMQEVKNLALNQNYYTRQKLQQDLQEKYQIKVRAIITPADVLFREGLGGAYDYFIAAQCERVKKRELKPADIGADKDYLNAEIGYTTLTELTNRDKRYADVKGVMFEYFLKHRPEETMSKYYFFDDSGKCLTAVHQANDESEHPVKLTTIRVDSQFRTATAEYVEAINSDAKECDLAEKFTERAELAKPVAGNTPSTVKAVEDHALARKGIDLFIAELNKYIDKRQEELITKKSQYNSFWGYLVGDSAKAETKILAAKNMISLLNGVANVELSEKQLAALRTDRLGEIIRKHEKKKLLPTQFLKYENAKIMEHIHFLGRR